MNRLTLPRVHELPLLHVKRRMSGIYSKAFGEIYAESSVVGPSK